MALRFDAIALAAFDLFLLNRTEAHDEYSDSEKDRAEAYFQKLSAADKKTLTNNIIAGLPGAEEAYSIDEFRTILESYSEIDAAQLKSNLVEFLKAIIPTAQEADVKMCIHPDDPPYPIFGLPRVVSTEADIIQLFEAVDSPYNGLTFCTGSFGVRTDNDLVGMIKRLGDRIHFVHLRSTKRDAEGSFYEADHLTGDVDMYAVMKALIEQQANRNKICRTYVRMPFRPDHGHQMLSDLNRKANPGYSAIGRLRCLAELRGLELGIRRSYK